jgi:hypothetical protein
MENKFAKLLVERLRKRSADYLKMARREDDIEEKSVAMALNETADCIEEALAELEMV